MTKRTGAEYHTALGNFSAAQGEFRLLNVTAGYGGRSYLSYAKIPAHLSAFCDWLNEGRMQITADDIASVYNLSFHAHYDLVTIHPWADGNGRMARLLMNLLQTEYGVLPSIVKREEKAEYIQALVDAREAGNPEIFSDLMARLHISHLEDSINRWLGEVADKLSHYASAAERRPGKVQQRGGRKPPPTMESQEFDRAAHCGITLGVIDTEEIMKNQ